MRTLTILTVFILLSTSVFSQRYVDSLHNFKINSGILIWQKVFETKQNTSKLIDQLKTKEFTSKLTFTDDQIFGRTTKYKKSVIKFSPYYASFGFDVFLTVDIKKNRIRITAKEFIFDGPTISIYGSEKKQNYPLQDQIIKRNKIKNNNSAKKVLKSLNSILINKFTLTELIKDDW